MDERSAGDAEAAHQEVADPVDADPEAAHPVDADPGDVPQVAVHRADALPEAAHQADVPREVDSPEAGYPVGRRRGAREVWTAHRDDSVASTDACSAESQPPAETSRASTDAFRASPRRGPGSCPD